MTFWLRNRNLLVEIIPANILGVQTSTLQPFQMSI